MAKKKGKTKRRATGEEPVVTRVKFPNRKLGEIFGRVVGVFGNDRMEVFCEDGKHRIGRIRGKIKKRVWIRIADLVIVNPWDWETQTDEKMGKCEITWRYMKHEISWLERNNKIPEILNINNIPL
ncbi:MAG: translation initiation factor eIF-1A [Promethearchaeota archaeon]